MELEHTKFSYILTAMVLPVTPQLLSFCDACKFVWA